MGHSDRFAQLGQFCTRMALNTQRIKIPYRTLLVASVLALAYVMNQSDQTITIGTWIAGTGARPKEKPDDQVRVRLHRWR